MVGAGAPPSLRGGPSRQRRRRRLSKPPQWPLKAVAAQGKRPTQGKQTTQVRVRVNPIPAGIRRVRVRFFARGHPRGRVKDGSAGKCLTRTYPTRCHP
jgi:hypothetical protein